MTLSCMSVLGSNDFDTEFIESTIMISSSKNLSSFVID